jgi:hypothetical protein
VLANHGSIVTGANVPDATVRAVMLEHCARVQVDAEKIGGKPIVPSPEFRSDYWSEVAPAMWNSCVRRLARTDPDLQDVPGAQAGMPPLRPEFPRRENPIVSGRGWTPSPEDELLMR